MACAIPVQEKVLGRIPAAVAVRRRDQFIGPLGTATVAKRSGNVDLRERRSQT